MFILEKKLPGNRIAFMINHSYREGKKVKAKTIKYFGIAHNISEQKVLRKLAKAELRKLSPKQKKEKVSDILSLKEKKRIIEGIHDVFGKEFDFLNLENNFTRIKLEQLKNVVMARIANPSSKLQASNILKKYYQTQLSEDQIYNLMDCLVKNEDFIKVKIFEATKKYTNKEDINLLFFDVTTLYFESQKKDDLKNFGYSKDNKVSEVQVVLALATTENGLPIGYQLFPGNTAETLTLITSIDKWRKLLPIKKIRIIADRAMMSGKNLIELEEANLEYIIAAKLKQLPKSLKEELWCLKKDFLQNDLDPVFIKEFNYQNRRLIIGYSKTRAEKDKKDRERTIEKLKEKLKKGKSKTKKLITNTGYLKYIEDKTDSEVTINEEKIDLESNWDGLYGYITNNYELTPEEVTSQYRRLWVIEESFRLNKHSLSMRPIYHYKPRRIQSHILICYIAFAISRFTQHKIKIMSFEKIREELLQVQASILEDKDSNRFYKVPSSMSKESLEIYKIMKVKRAKKPSLYENVV